MPGLGYSSATAQEARALSQIRGSAGGLVEWSRRDPWRERMGELVEKHIRKACDLNDIDLFELPEVIGEAAMTAMDCAFEDCCARTWEDGSNLARDYLKRRGWKETAINRAYIEALRDSTMSLYEVSDVRPGESFLARDLVRGGDPIRVTERTATKTLVAWDVIACRIVTVRGVVQMTSGGPGHRPGPRRGDPRPAPAHAEPGAGDGGPDLRGGGSGLAGAAGGRTRYRGRDPRVPPRPRSPPSG